MAAHQLDPNRYIASLEAQLGDAQIQLARANAFIAQLLEERKHDSEQGDAEAPRDKNGGAFAQSFPDGIVTSES